MKQLPKQWVMEVTKENTETLIEWRTGLNLPGSFPSRVGEYPFIRQSGWCTMSDIDNYPKITFEDFLEHVYQPKLKTLPEKWKVKINNWTDIQYYLIDKYGEVDSWAKEFNDFFLYSENVYGFCSPKYLSKISDCKYTEITYQDFIMHTQELKTLPKEWCVLNDGSQLFKDTIIEYLNKPIDCIKIWKYDGDSFNSYYGISSEGGGSNRRAHEKSWGTILTIDQFIKLTKMTKEIKYPIVTGKSNLLKAFLQDCLELGFKQSVVDQLQWNENSISLKFNGNAQFHFDGTNDPYALCFHSYVDNYSSNLPSVTFNLPEDYTKALECMKSFVPKLPPQFKVGDWVLANGNISGYENQIGQIKEIELTYHDKYRVIYSNGSRIWSTPIRLATPEEIRQFQYKGKIFSMSSTSGAFELEVDKRGIYYKPEDVYLSVDFLWKFTDPSCKLPVKGDVGYTVKVTKVDVGCKKDTLVSQWIEVYDYYNSIKD